MKTIMRKVTDFTATKKGMWITLSIWLVATMLLAMLAPGAKQYEVSSIDSFAQDAPSVLAQTKIDQHFADTDEIPALLVFQSKSGELKLEELSAALEKIGAEQIDGLKKVISLAGLPPQATASFFSADKTTAVIPISFDASLGSKELSERLDQIKSVADRSTPLSLNITGPAGIAADSLNLFSRADIVLLLSTIGLILILLIVIYRSPLLALIPLVAVAFVYEVVNQLLGLLGKAGVELSKQSLSIMSILLIAAITDYSLFVFSRFREELKNHQSKHDAMKLAMRETGIPVFFSGGTVLVAMLILFFADYGDSRNFAPIFGTAIFVIMLASVTLVPALFTLFGRKSFWPKIPKVGDAQIVHNSLWSKVGRFLVKKPLASALSILLLLVLAASNMFNLTYEFDTIKSFPSDMPSRVGYELLQEKFEKGDLAPTTVLFESEKELSKAEQEKLRDTLSAQPLVNNVRLSGVSDDAKAVRYSLTFADNPYAAATLDALQMMRDESASLLKANDLAGELYFAGETATKVDDRAVNNRDLLVIVLIESVLIFAMLVFLTRSLKMPLYMMGTILLSFLSAVGIGIFLTELIFDIDAVSNRVPLYTFVFLVALGIDYNIILISRFMEERKKHPVKKAVEIAVASTGGVISSAGFLLAATFAVLMTQPIQVLSTFGFIVAIGILLDTFLIRGILLPSLIVLFEKEKPAQ
ncbi:MMPL family transporter [Tumebacillus lipolyticus]|uniref:MMPL family transporter n=1 Tax=Tumebacillus lipolyticus TaxID=1280370 RepID=A0ABW4ZXH7_9BACL